MKIGVLTLIGGLAACSLAGERYDLFDEGERVVCVGDSITHGGMYPYYLQLAQLLRHPGSTARVFNAGISGGTCAEAIARWSWDIRPMKGTLSFLMFGMNDVNRNYYLPGVTGDTLAADRQKAIDAYAANERTMSDLILGEGGKLILVTPTPYDEYGTWETSAACVDCNEIGLTACAAEVRKLAATLKVPYVEQHEPLTASLKRGETWFKIRDDRTHPEEAGHLAMLEGFLKTLNVSSEIAAVTVSAAGRVLLARHAAVTGVQASKGALSFTYAPEALPFPDFTAWHEPLKITGLAVGMWELKADGGSLGEYSHAELAEGIDLARLETPSMARARKSVVRLGKWRNNDVVPRDIARMMVQAEKLGADLTSYESVCAALDRWFERNIAGTSNDSYYRNLIGVYKNNATNLTQVAANIETQISELVRITRPAAYGISLVQVSSEVVDPKVFYVNPNGDDSYDGKASVWNGKHGPKRTLAGVMAAEGLSDGCTVLAAEGTYAEGNYGNYRVLVPAGVTLKASGRKERTFIVGAADPNGTNGCGGNAVQCVNLGQRAKLVGFTVHGGRGSNWADTIAGAGITGAAQNGDNASVVIDCVVSNCVAGRGAAVQSATIVRCSFSGNLAKKMGCDTYNVDAYNCFYGTSQEFRKYDAQWTRLFNCRVSGSAHGCWVYNSYVATDMGLNEFRYSMYSQKGGSETSTYGEGSVKTSMSTVDGNMRPVKGSYYGIDLGSVEIYNDLNPAINRDYLMTDYAGGERVLNGQIDIGCGEYDVRLEVAAQICIATMPGFAIKTLPSAYSCADGKLTLTGGELLCGWQAVDENEYTCYCLAGVTKGTLSVYVGEETTPRWVLTGEEQTLTLKTSGDVVYRFVVSEGGEASVSAFDRSNVFYVDPAGDNAYDGKAAVWDGTHGPKQTLQAAVALPAADHGDMILAAEGTYDQGGTGLYRLHLTKSGVTIKASGDKRKTFIIGQLGSGENGCGDGALMCAYLGANTRLEGFTICGGRGATFTGGSYVGGVKGENRSTTLVVDCIISNCASGRAAGAYVCTAIRCEFSGNRVKTSGSDVMSVSAYNCYFHGSLSSAKYDVYMSTLYNCTVLGYVRDSYAYNTRIGNDSEENHFYHCAYSTRSGTSESYMDEGCYQASQPAVDANVRPIYHRAADVDAGSWALYDDPATGVVKEYLSADFAGGERVCNGEVDVGCGEYDWFGVPGAAFYLK